MGSRFSDLPISDGALQGLRNVGAQASGVGSELAATTPTRVCCCCTWPSWLRDAR